jgi:hypothetical protein
MSEPAKTLRLPNEYTSPPGQWRYRVPETGEPLAGSNLPELIQKVQAHLQANDYPVPADIKERIIEYICATIPGYCEGDSSLKAKIISLAHTFHVGLKGTLAMAKWGITSRQFVSQEQADSRALVCSTCILNDSLEGCTSCNAGKLADAVVKIVGKRRTAYHDKLKHCRACVCNNQGKVWFPIDTILKNTAPEDKAKLREGCWILEEEKALVHYD